ncbi:MAG: DNA cytosine methyltransferase [Oscillospiraceae bacterium]|nr:DNA cytosine methyltransferase [Oscillospiraceae bacterium]MCL2278122.1 DNA cytosine methyltransferase [Oscillospiraceae bacterium]
MEQISFDHLTKERFIIDKPVRLIELFCGIGAFSKALTRLGVEHESYRAVDFCKYKIAGFNAIHGMKFGTTDITELHGNDLGIIDAEDYVYILTYSFPCQDLSNAGKRQGMKRDGGTRSGLLWEVERIIDELTELPQVLIMENVVAVHDSANVDSFREWVIFLESKGYTSYSEDLNAKDYEVPQNRDRCFMVSLLDGFYTFPLPVPLAETLKDRLEPNVDEKYYLSDESVQKLLNSTFEQQTRRIQTGGGAVAQYAPETPKTRSVSKAVRKGGRGSTDRHEWDMIYE